MKTLVDIGRRVYGHDGTAINRHSERLFRDDEGMRYILSRTLDGIPPFFEAYGPFKEDHEGCLPHLKVNGKEYWGDGWTWKGAEKAFCLQLEAVIVAEKTKQTVHCEHHNKKEETPSDEPSESRQQAAE